MLTVPTPWALSYYSDLVLLYQLSQNLVQSIAVIAFTVFTVLGIVVRVATILFGSQVTTTISFVTGRVFWGVLPPGLANASRKPVCLGF